MTNEYQKTTGSHPWLVVMVGDVQRQNTIETLWTIAINKDVAEIHGYKSFRDRHGIIPHSVVAYPIGDDYAVRSLLSLELTQTQTDFFEGCTVKWSAGYVQNTDTIVAYAVLRTSPELKKVIDQQWTPQKLERDSVFSFIRKAYQFLAK